MTWGAIVGATQQVPQTAASTLLTDIVAAWHLDEASGARADATGRGNNLTDNNTVTQAAGKIGNAAQFTRANSEYLSREDNADLTMGDIDFTFAAWFYLDSKPVGAAQAILSKYSGGGQDCYELYYWETPDRLRLLVSSTGANQVEVVAAAFGSPALSTWHLVVAWHDAANDTINIQVDDGAVNSVAHALGVFAGNAQFRIGAVQFGGGSHFWDGRIDAAHIWKRVLTAAERTELYNAGNGREYPFS